MSWLTNNWLWLLIAYLAIGLIVVAALRCLEEGTERRREQLRIHRQYVKWKWWEYIVNNLIGVIFWPLVVEVVIDQSKKFKDLGKRIQ